MADTTTTSTSLFVADTRTITVHIKEIQEHLICYLCNGCLRAAHTIKECAHSFCNSCIRSYFILKGHSTCPKCNVSLGCKPWNSLISDPALQGLADKLLSDYRAKEYAEMHTFYRKHGFRRRVDTTKNVKSQTTDVIKPAPTTTTKLKFTLRPQRVKELPLTLCMARLKRSNMCTNPKGRIQDLRKYLAYKLNRKRHDDIEILCRGCVVGPEHSLEFVQRVFWSDDHSMMALEYRRTNE